MRSAHNKRAMFRKISPLFIAVFPLLFSACQPIMHWQYNAGPTRKEVAQSATLVYSNRLAVVDVDLGVASRLQHAQLVHVFGDMLTQSTTKDYRIRAGDVIDVSIWESPPALLFGGASDLSNISTSKEVRLPEQMVDASGFITVPFVGRVPVVGKSLTDVQTQIIKGLTGKANQPSVIVRTVKNNAANVTVIGEVNTSLRMPLTGRGERILDAIAAAGGSKYPTGKVMVQLNRGYVTQSVPLDRILREPNQNVQLQAGDVVSLSYQPTSFTALGAVSKNDEIYYESTGISLMQALARSGGLNDGRADSRGVFVFRYEDPKAMSAEVVQKITQEARVDGKIPVIYRLDLKDPMNYLIAQKFPIQNKDVVYVSNAPAAEFAKFVNLVSQGVFSITGLRNLGSN